MKNVVLLSVLAVNLLGAASSFAQTSTIDPSPAFGYRSYAEPGTRSPVTATDRTYSPNFGYPEPNTSSPTTSGQTNSLGSGERVPVVVGR
jgi:hypothetical protein